MGAAPIGFRFRVSLRVFRHNCGIRLFSHQLVLGHGVGYVGEPVEEAGPAVQVLPASISLLPLSQEATMRNAVTFPGTEELAVLPAWGLLSAPPADILVGLGVCRASVTGSAPSRLTFQSNKLESGGYGEGQGWGPGLQRGTNGTPKCSPFQIRPSKSLTPLCE